jgi:hypothetical protein
MSSRSEEIFNSLGQDKSPTTEVIFQLKAKDLIKALQKMDENAVLYGRGGIGEMKDALWQVADPLVRKMALAPDGKTFIEVK